MIALGIPSLNRFDLLVRCIASALASSVAPDRIYVIDNSSGAYPQDWQKPYRDRVLVHRAPSNYGVAKSWNLLVAAAQGQDIILSNDDIVFAPDTIQLLLEEAARNGQAAIVSAIEGQRFSLFWLRRIAYTEIGKFDEQFYPAYFEDNDWARRATLAHWQLAVAPSNVEHGGSATLQAYTPEQREQHHQQFAANRRRYLEKWGGPPHQEVYTEPYGGAR